MPSLIDFADKLLVVTVYIKYGKKTDIKRYISASYYDFMKDFSKVLDFIQISLGTEDYSITGIDFTELEVI